MIPFLVETVARMIERITLTREPVRITMLGPRGVGKTSLLASMYDRFNEVEERMNLLLAADLTTIALLREKLADLKSQIWRDEVGDGGVAATAEPRRYTLELGCCGGKPELKLIFRDFPGEYFLQNEETQKAVIEYIRESSVVILAIDAPSLMEENGRWSEEVNCVFQVCEFFKHAMMESSREKLILLTPVKCEKYLHEDKGDELSRKIRESYKVLLNLLAMSFAEQRIALAVTPVQTLGGVHFERIELTEGNKPLFFYKRVIDDNPYCPVDIEQPLYYILSFAIVQALERIGQSEVHREFSRALDILSRSRKDEGKGFFLVQGRSLLGGSANSEETGNREWLEATSAISSPESPSLEGPPARAESREEAAEEVARELKRGERVKLREYVVSDNFDVKIKIFGLNGKSVDFHCFGLNERNKVLDNDYVLYKPGAFPCNSVRFAEPSDSLRRDFGVDLSALDDRIRKIVFSISTVEPTRVAHISNGHIAVFSAGKPVLRYTFSGKEFVHERSLMIGEIYWKRAWRFAAVGQGFSKGEKALLGYFLRD